MRRGCALLLIALPWAAPAAEAKRSPNLVVSSLTASLASGKLSFAAVTRNRGSARASASRTALLLSADARRSRDDVLIGSRAIPRLKPGKEQRRAGGIAVPVAVGPGTYRVLACADADRRVRERDESDNCRV